MADDFLQVMKVLPDPVGSFMQGRQDAANLQTTNLQNQTQQFALQQAQQQAQQAQTQNAAYQADLGQFIRNPTSEGAANLALKYPAQQKAITDAWNMRDKSAQDADRQGLAMVYSALANKRPDIAKQYLQQRHDADTAIGKPNPNTEALLGLVDSDPDAAKGMAAYALASIPGGEDFAKTLSAVGDGKDDGSVVVNQGGALVRKSTGEVLYQAGSAPKYEKIKDAEGNEHLIEIPQSVTGTSAAPTAGIGGQAVPASLLLPAIKAQESGGDYTARNAQTGALGAYQIMPATGAALAKRLGVSWQPGLMTSDTPTARAYQDKIGQAAVQEAVANTSNVADAARYYHGGSDQAKWGPKTQAYAAQVLDRIGAPTGAGPANIPAGARDITPTSVKGGDPASSGPGGLDQSDIAYYAQQVLAGAPMPSIGMGKTAAAVKTAIMHEVAKQAGASGLTGADLARQIAHYKAGSAQIKNLEVMAGNVSQAEQTALANGQQALDRAAEIPGQTSFGFVNSAIQSIARHTGNTAIVAHDAALNTFLNEYAKVVAGSPNGSGVLSDSARHEAQATLQGNYSLAQKQAAFAQMKADMANRIAAIHNGINDAYTHLTSKPGYVVPNSTAELGGNARPAATGGHTAPAGATRAVRNPKTGQIAYLINGKWVIQ